MRADRQRAQLTFDPGVPEVPPPRGWPDGFAGGRAERGALLVLASMRGIRPLDLHALAWKEGSPAGCVAAIRSGRAGSDGDRMIADELDPAEVEAALAACGARLVAPGSAEYLPGFLDLRDPPVALFVEGSSMNQLGTCVAVVGARNCTPAGRDLAHDVGAGLGAAGVTVASGAARGIDRAAHEGALDAGGPSVAVLGCGIDIAYPRGSRKVIARCRERGALVSEYPPGVPPEPHRFPARNRLIAGLASAVVLVEGVTDSGSLITAGHALDIGRQVFAVPGSVTSPLAGDRSRRSATGPS